VFNFQFINKLFLYKIGPHFVFNYLFNLKLKFYLFFLLHLLFVYCLSSC
jgi:hypothetical protein